MNNRKGKPRFSRAYVEITNICNRHCSFCPGTTRPPTRMSIDNFVTVMERLRPVTEYVYLHIMGEPLSHPQLCDMIRLANKRGMKCAITTNGTLLSKVGEELLSSGVYKINISLHSFEEGTDEEYLDYLDKCYTFARHFSDAGILTVVRLWNRGYDEGRNIDTLRILHEYFPSGEWVEDERGARIRHKLHLEFGDRFDWPDLSAVDLGDRVYCHGLRDHIGVLSDGRVVPCCLDGEGTITLGNVFDSPLAEILTSPRAQAIKEGFARRHACEELCRRCGYARRFK